MRLPFIATCLLLISHANLSHASDELLAAVLAEQEAFKTGDCDKLESMIAEDVTFYANGTQMSRGQVKQFCINIPRPFGAGRDPLDDTVTPFMLGENRGYTVRDFRWEDKDNRVFQEVVSKVWVKGNDGWKIVHFQSTVVPERPTKPAGK